MSPDPDESKLALMMIGVLVVCIVSVIVITHFVPFPDDEGLNSFAQFVNESKIPCENVTFNETRPDGYCNVNNASMFCEWKPIPDNHISGVINCQPVYFV